MPWNPDAYVDYRDYLRKAVEAICQNKLLAHDDVQIAWKLHDALQAVFDPDLIGACVEKYIGTELDTKARGVRGIGRMTTDIPRLGGWYRREIRALREGDRIELQRLIRDVVLAGYFAAVLVHEGAPEDRFFTDETLLYHAWIPTIYGVGILLREDPDKIKVILAIVLAPLAALRKFMDAHSMRENRLTLLLTKEKQERIVLGYLDAGLLLRRIEINKTLSLLDHADLSKMWATIAANEKSRRI